jgi:hypothetical protein
MLKESEQRRYQKNAGCQIPEQVREFKQFALGAKCETSAEESCRRKNTITGNTVSRLEASSSISLKPKNSKS